MNPRHNCGKHFTKIECAKRYHDKRRMSMRFLYFQWTGYKFNFGFKKSKELKWLLSRAKIRV